MDNIRLHDRRRETRRGDGRRCLVIDDDAVVLKFVAHMLTVLGYEVDTAVNKPTVASRLSAAAYDLIVTDLEMPDMNGYILATQLKNDSRTATVIVMTGRPEAGCSAMMDAGGPDGWIFKPFGLNDLRSTLEEAGMLKP
jgi:CheY-like chemotaxis protein